jgi:SAM-dependent methyltransferase
VTPPRRLREFELGHAFEASLSDERLGLRKQKGIFYTSEILATHLAASALSRFGDRAGLRILDPACGAGAFLVPARRDGHLLFGADLLPEAVEVAKQAIARPANLVVHDSLDVDGLFGRLDVPPGAFDLVLGNPPWGADMSPRQRRDALAMLGMPDHEDLDIWELFVAIALHALRPGGRLALVLPDTLFSPEKAWTRRLLIEQTTIEKLHNLGPDWFGSRIRMGTVVVQACKRRAPRDHCFASLLLHGEPRRRAILGELPLTELEARSSRSIPQHRSVAPDYALEVFRDVRDDALMHRMVTHGVPLASVCERARGEEMAKSGLLWKCPGCSTLTTPGTKMKGGGFHSTRCPRCGQVLDEDNAETLHLVTNAKPRGRAAAFLDGDDLPGRYKPANPSRWIRLDTSFDLKPESLYEGPKILVRQAGVGIAATLDESHTRCPQSIYLYRVNPEHAAWGNEYVLAVLLSRAMAYQVFKRFCEVDPARAHAKLTHKRLAELPVPRLDPSNRRHARLGDQIRRDVRALLAGAALGGREDQRIELAVRELYGLTPEDGDFIDAELRALPASQALQELFPADPREARSSRKKI